MSTYKIELELESFLDEVKLKQYFEDNFDMDFLQIKKIDITKENDS